MMGYKIWLLLESLLLTYYSITQADAIQCVKISTTHEATEVSCTSFCMAVWRNDSGIISNVSKGCWNVDHDDWYSDDECRGKTFKSRNVIMCFCIKDYCNRNLTWVGYANESAPPTTTGNVLRVHEKKDYRILFAIAAIGCVFFVLITVLLIYLKTRSDKIALPKEFTKNGEVEKLLSPSELAPIELRDILSQGQFCMVRKGRMGHVDVAVKIFPVTQRSKPTPSALTEKDIYISCNLNHENILRFIGARSHEDGGQFQLWLVTEYIEQGSLSDFLKRNSINWDNLFHMAQGMALGMAYLHAEIPRLKPSIAHRDIKSKNILVKNNLTCCISDFGLSLKFDDKDGPGDTHGQVGTRRYMSPEVLEGAINFSREAFLRIDMYALALCLWELLTRCTAVQEEPVRDYKLPFEEEVGIHPTLEELQEFVVYKKLRPKFPKEWKNKNVGIDGIMVTIEECWDHDADARLTADCVAERIKQLYASSKRQAAAPLTLSLNCIEHENALLA